MFVSFCLQGNAGSDGPPGRDGAAGVKVTTQANALTYLFYILVALFNQRNIIIIL